MRNPLKVKEEVNVVIEKYKGFLLSLVVEMTKKMELEVTKKVDSK